jgi:nitrous oxidase accessory protein NosD
MLRLRPWNRPGFVVCAALAAVLSQPAIASAACVNPGGTGGCFSSINAAIAATFPGGIVLVAPGTYKEDVVIGKPLSLIGSGASTTIIDATGLSNAIYVDGLDNPGLRNVIVTGFTAKNANFEGILVTNAASVMISRNTVTGNNVGLSPKEETCLGQPPFETGEDFDCGEGIHIMGVSFSTITKNVSSNNSGGILISDDTGATHDNLIASNVIKDNPFDCGITLASHAPGPGSTAPHNGIIRNIISNNISQSNGTIGEGAGLGIFSDGSGIGLVSGNIVTNNEILDNGIPGVAFHSHVGPNFGAPADNLNGNYIINNHISGNGADLGDTATPGPTGINLNSGFGGTPITGTVIWGNKIENESVDIAVNTPAKAAANFNSLLGGDIGVANLGSGSVDATNNYWGCSAGPTSPSCSRISGPNVTFIPFFPFPLL